MNWSFCCCCCYILIFIISTAGDLGPSDGTVVVTPATGNWAVSLTSIGGNLEEVVGAVNSE